MGGGDRRSGKEERDGGGGGNRVPVKNGTEAVNIIRSLLLCGGSALEGLEIACPEKDEGMAADACITEGKSLEAGIVVDSVTKKVIYENA